MDAHAAAIMIETPNSPDFASMLSPRTLLSEKELVPSAPGGKIDPATKGFKGIASISGAPFQSAVIQGMALYLFDVFWTPKIQPLRGIHDIVMSDGPIAKSTAENWEIRCKILVEEGRRTMAFRTSESGCISLLKWLKAAEPFVRGFYAKRKNKGSPFGKWTNIWISWVKGDKLVLKVLEGEKKETILIPIKDKRFAFSLKNEDTEVELRCAYTKHKDLPEKVKMWKLKPLGPNTAKPREMHLMLLEAQGKDPTGGVARSQPYTTATTTIAAAAAVSSAAPAAAAMTTKR